MKNKIICFLFGHKIGILNDSGYPVCERCGAHSFYDDIKNFPDGNSNKWNNAGWLMIHKKIYRAISYYKMQKNFKRIYSDGLPF